MAYDATDGEAPRSNVQAELHCTITMHQLAMALIAAAPLIELAERYGRCQSRRGDDERARAAALKRHGLSWRAARR